MKKIIITVLIFILFLGINAFAKENLNKIQQAIEESGANWDAGENPILMLSPEERRALLGVELEEIDDSERITPPRQFRGERLTYLDWRDFEGINYVTAVKDQASCGSCWAFGAIGAMESKIAIEYGVADPVLDFSEQFMVSCSSGSCNGYTASGTYNFLLTTGTPTEDCLPYGATDAILCSEKCDDWQMKRRKISDWQFVSTNVEAIKTALESGPLGATFLVYSDFYAYTGGVYEHVWGEVEGGHMVTMVGYDEDLECWICKNSWGENWGEDGYFRIKWGEADINSGAGFVVLAEAVYPDIDYVSHSIEEVDGDFDGLLNPGETANLVINIQNMPCWEDAQNIVATLSCDDSRMQIIDDQAMFPDLLSGDAGDNLDDVFTFQVSADAQIEPIPVTLHIEANNEGDSPYYVDLQFDIQLTLDQLGWPLYLEQIVRSSPIAYDLDEDGNKEIIFGANDKKLYVKNDDGTDFEQFPFDAQNAIFGAPAIGDVDNDGDSEIVVTSFDTNVYILQHTGEILNTISTDGIISATPALSDLDNDGDLEIIVGNNSGSLNVVHHTGDSFSAVFPYQLAEGALIANGAAIADINDDGQPEIIFGSTDHHIYAIDLAGEPVWDFETGNNVRCAPSVADFPTGRKVICGSWDGFLYILNADGTVFHQYETAGKIFSSPSLADVDSDGTPEIFFGSEDGRLYAIDGDGSTLNGFPVETEAAIEGSPSVSDVDGDGELEIAIGSRDHNVYVFNVDGSAVPPFPLNTGNRVCTSFSFADVDSDSDIELIYGNDDQLGIVDIKTETQEVNCWNTYRGNSHRTGNYQDLGITGIADENGVEIDSPRRFALYPNYPNPFNPTTHINYELPAVSQVEITIYNINGQLIKTLIHDTQRAGYHSVQWNGTDENHRSVSSGVYFYKLEATSKQENNSDIQSMILLK